MFTIKYCTAWNYYPQAASLSAQINSHMMDTCEIEEGENGQFDVFHSGELILSKKPTDNFFTLEDVESCLAQVGSKD